MFLFANLATIYDVSHFLPPSALSSSALALIGNLNYQRWLLYYFVFVTHFLRVCYVVAPGSMRWNRAWRWWQKCWYNFQCVPIFNKCNQLHGKLISEHGTSGASVSGVRRKYATFYTHSTYITMQDWQSNSHSSEISLKVRCRKSQCISCQYRSSKKLLLRTYAYSQYNRSIAFASPLSLLQSKWTKKHRKWEIAFVIRIELIFSFHTNRAKRVDWRSIS